MDAVTGISPWGPVETRYRTWVATLGELSDRQQATVEQIYRLAALLDGEGGGAGASALSRELRQVVAEFRSVKVTADTNQVDEVAQRRKLRRQPGRKPSTKEGDG